MLVSWSRISQSLTPGGGTCGSCSSSRTIGNMQRPGAGCSGGVASTSALRSLANRVSTASQFGAVSNTAWPAIGSRHSRKTVAHSGSSASRSKRKGSTGVDKLAP
ncbi:hypothetical protein D3C85_1405680 [compost metagenome]